MAGFRFWWAISMISPEPRLWDGILAHLRQHYPARCRQWFSNIRLVGIDGGIMRLCVDEPVQLKYLRSDCTDMFREAAQAVTGRLVAIQFHPESTDLSTPDRMSDDQDAAAAYMVEPRVGVAPPGPLPVSRTTGDPFCGTWFDDMVINPDYTFENFIECPNNRLARSASMAVGDNPGVAYNPLFIHGGVGLGKTHLLQAICLRIMQRRPGARIYYISCEGFISRFLEAVQRNEMAEFRGRFRHVDVLVVDDIHYLARHERIQEEFFHTFNSLYQARKQIVLSSDAAPEEMPDLEARLLSRFKQGLVARIGRPEYETRVLILRRKALLRGLEVPDDVVCYIAQRVEDNTRVLEGALTQVQGLAMATSRSIDVDLAREALGDHTASRPPAIISIQAIIDTVSRQFEVKQTEMLSKRRQKSIALPRQVAMFLARRYTAHSLEEVGGYFGGRDHTTVMHAVKKVKQLRQKDEGFDRFVGEIERELGAADRITREF